MTSAVLWLATGCTSTKQTWGDWEKVRNAPQSLHEAQFIPPTLELPRGTNIGTQLPSGYKIGEGAKAGPGFDLAMRNPDFPNTYIEAVYIDISDPATGLHVKWTGPNAAMCPTGPWRDTPGRGTPDLDCDSVEDSNLPNSLCTPKGTFPVAGFADHLHLTPICLYATWILYAPRFIAIHSHTDLPDQPASAGCIRVPFEAAKLIHNNSLTGITVVNITGTWHRPLVKTWQHPASSHVWQRSTSTK
ncbi:MAG TPA: L,D-transpeptidase [Verrucomicrobiae bacterium]|nr:L,D-transpeptidase [Verrucomicrobiae bacterium]